MLDETLKTDDRAEIKTANRVAGITRSPQSVHCSTTKVTTVAQIISQIDGVVTIDSGVVTIDSDILESRPTIDQFEHSFRYFNLSDSNFWTTDSPKYSSVRHSYPWPPHTPGRQRTATL